MAFVRKFFNLTSYFLLNIDVWEIFVVVKLNINVVKEESSAQTMSIKSNVCYQVHLNNNVVKYLKKFSVLASST